MNKVKKKSRRGFTRLECRIWLAIILVLALVFYFISVAGVVATEDVQIDGSGGVTNADFTNVELIPIDGGESITQDSLAQYKLTVINYWETSCIFCIKEMPDLNALAKEYDGQVQFIGVCVDTMDDNGVNEARVADAKRILKLRGQAYPQTMPSVEHLQMTKQIVAYPETYFVDSTGQVLKVISGAHNIDQWRATVDDLLKQVH